MTRSEQMEKITNDLVALWDTSGKEYRCIRNIHDVIERPAQQRCNGTAIRARAMINRAVAIIHKRWLAAQKG